MGTQTRKTRKFVAAQACAFNALSDVPRDTLVGLSSAELYMVLEAHSFWWDNKGGVWKKAERRVDGKFSGSMFEESEGVPSGVYRLRLMCHPEEAEAITKHIKTFCDVIEVSDVYPNRKGAGVRIYLTCVL